MTWDQVENTLTMEQLLGYRRYWDQHPPTHILAAAFMGYKKEAPKPMQSFMETIGGMQGVQVVKLEKT